jgi:hypothetical protein
MNTLKMYEAGLIKMDAEQLDSVRKFATTLEEHKQRALLAVAAQADAADTADDDAALVKAVTEYMILFGSEERPHVFVDLNDNFSLSGATFWKLLHQEWKGFDRIPHRPFSSLMVFMRDHWRVELLNDEDREFYNTLPELLTVYRGQDAASPVGLSWTLDREVAAGFARGHRLLFNKSPIIISAEVAKRHVAGAYTEREEKEIVLFRPSQAVRRRRLMISPRRYEDPTIGP